MRAVRGFPIVLSLALLAGCQSIRSSTVRHLDLVSATRINPDGSVQRLERTPGTTAGTFSDEHVRGYVGAMRDHFDIYLHFRHDTLALIHWDWATYKDTAGGDYMGLMAMDSYDMMMDIVKRGDIRTFVGPEPLATVRRARGEGLADTRFPPFLQNLPPGATAELTIPAHIQGKSYKYVFSFRKPNGM